MGLVLLVRVTHTWFNWVNATKAGVGKDDDEISHATVSDLDKHVDTFLMVQAILCFGMFSTIESSENFLLLLLSRVVEDYPVFAAANLCFHQKCSGFE